MKGGNFSSFQLGWSKWFLEKVGVLRTLYEGRGGGLMAFWQKENIPITECGREKLRWGRNKWCICLAGWAIGMP